MTMKKYLLFIFLCFSVSGLIAKDPLAKQKKAYESSVKAKSKRDFVRAYSASKKLVSNTAIEKDPALYADVLLNHVEIEYLIKGHSHEVDKQIESIIKLAPKQSPENKGKVEIEIAKIYFLMGEYSKAVDMLAKVSPKELTDFYLAEYKLFQARLNLRLGYNLTVIREIEQEFKTSEKIPAHLISKYRAVYAYAVYNYGDHAKTKETIENIKNTYWKDKNYKQDLYLFTFIDALIYEDEYKYDDEVQELTTLLEVHNNRLSATHVRDEIISPEFINEYLIITKYQLKHEDRDAIHNKYNTNLDAWYGRTSIKVNNKQLLDAKQHIMLHEYKDAESYLNDIINQDDFYKYKSYYSEALNLYMLCKIQLKDFAGLQADFDNYLNFISQNYPKNCPEYRKAELERASYLANHTNSTKEAKKIFEDIFSSDYASQKSPENNELDNYKEVYANLLAEFGYMEKSMAISSELLRITAYKFDKNTPIYNYKLTNHALLSLKAGKYQDALSEIEAVLDYYKDIKAEGLDVAEALKAKAIILMASADYSEAEGLLIKANRMLKVPEEKKYFNKSFSLTRLYLEQGRYNKVNKILYEFIEDLTSIYGATNKNLLPVYTERAWYLEKAGLYKDVEDQCLINSAIADSAYGKTAFYADQEEILSLVHYERGDFENALEHNKQALKIRLELYGENHYKVGLSLKDEALITYNLSLLQNDKIKQLFEKSLKIISSSISTKSHLYALTLQDYARFLLEIGENTNAENKVVQVESLWKEIGLKQKTNTYYSELLLLRGDIAKAKNENEKAEGYYSQASSNIVDVFGEEHPLYGRSLSRLSRIYYIKKDKEKTIKTTNSLIKLHLDYINTYFSSLSEREKTKYWLLIKNDFEFYHNVVLRYKNENPILIDNLYNLTLQTKSILLNNSIKIRESVYKSNDPELIQIYSELIQKKEDLLTQLNTSKQEKSGDKDQSNNLDKDIRRLEKLLSEKVSFFKPNIDKITEDDIKKGLKPNQYAVEIVQFRYFDKNFTDSIVYLALILDQNPEHGILTEVFKYGNKMEKEYFNYFRNTKMLKVEDKFSYEIFWEPVTKHIPEKSTVFISPDGIYNLINPETFQKSDGSYLLDKYDFRILSNTKDILYEYQDSIFSEKTAMLIGNPTFYPNDYKGYKYVKPLPGAEKEINEIAAIFDKYGWKHNTFTNAHALEDTVKYISSPSILHFATHGYFKPEKEVLNDNLILKQQVSTSLFAAGLVLANGGLILDKKTVEEYNDERGLLTAYEVLNLNLNNTKIVVLSACETGLGTGEIGDGVYGLQKAFLVAGAQSVVMSIFKVDDAITRELMTNFYNLWLSGMELHKAFNKAKIIIKEKYKDPIYWGSFVLIEK